MSKAKILLAIAVLLAILAAVFVWTARETLNEPALGGEDEAIFCTMDAFECPDGSFVGRVAPSCDFAPCPGN